MGFDCYIYIYIYIFWFLELYIFIYFELLRDLKNIYYGYFDKE